MIKNKIVITEYRGGILLLHYLDGRVEKLYYDCIDSDRVTVGDILIGTVTNVSKTLDAAFVRLSATQNAFVPEGRSLGLQQGDMKAFLVTKEAYGTKDAVVTPKLSLSGTYAVADDSLPRVGISQKISPAIKAEMKSYLSGKEHFSQRMNLLETDLPVGVIFRTDIEEAIRKALDEQTKQSVLAEAYEEAIALSFELEELLKVAPYRTEGSVLYRKDPDWLAYLKRLIRIGAFPEEVVTDVDSVYLRCREDRVVKKASEVIRKYSDAQFPLSLCISLEKTMEEIFARKVYLKSGAYLIVDQTEACVVIDVNSGKDTHGKEKESEALSINKEAASEILRILRLRNLSGMILIDFINLQKEESIEELMNVLSKLSSREEISTSVVDMTKLGIVEMTRAKQKAPIVFS